jgi:soluble lytic murein transglycosylase
MQQQKCPQESGFDQRDMSSAKAVGLMQVTPVAGRDTAKRFGVSYDIAAPSF